MSSIFINYQDTAQYPYSKDGYSPDYKYPEYRYNDISSQKNYVYEMIRESFFQLGYDKENFGTPNWNPLGYFIKPGQYVLIKPNMVLHENHIKGNGIECLITHPSLVRAVIDYVLIALQGSGKILVGDAPVQSCDFEKLLTVSGYMDLMNFYKHHGIDLEVVDFRNYKTIPKKGILVPESEVIPNKSVIVDLKNKSAFSKLSETQLRNLRITNYDPRIMYEHHNHCTNEYLIAREVLYSDVIINMPKPKTHRKAGVTISLKNIVGINTNKEWLPHHTMGAKEEQGDEYDKKNIFSSMNSRLFDYKNIAIAEQKFVKARLLQYLASLSLHFIKYFSKNDSYSEGSWFGNDTIWRTIYDLNMILMYADKNGTLCDTRQRQMLIIGDMIISGEKEGPLLPSSKHSGIIAIGDNPVSFDEAIYNGIVI